MSTKTQPQLAASTPRKIVTPITGALSLVIGVSGVMLFFHFEERLVKEVHEWLGMAFVAAMLIHLALNWSAFKKHFRKPAAWVGTATVSAISIMFLAASLSGTPSGNPTRLIMRSIETTAVYDLAPVFKVSHLEISKRFDEAGVVIVSGQETIQELASSSGVDSRQLIAALTKK